MELIERFTLSEMQQFWAVYDWLKANGYNSEDIGKELKKIKQSKEEAQRTESSRDKKRLQEFIAQNPNMSKAFPLCPDCKVPLTVKEAEIHEAESVYICQYCDYEKFSDKSPHDINSEIHAKLKGKKPEFKTEEIRASKKERDARRKICMACEQLEGVVCKACGCSMKHRTYYEILTCPKRKW